MILCSSLKSTADETLFPRIGLVNRLSQYPYLSTFANSPGAVPCGAIAGRVDNPYLLQLLACEIAEVFLCAVDNVVNRFFVIFG